MALTQKVTDIEQLQAQRIGYIAVSLTNYDSDLEPAVAEGSVVEVGGAVYEAVADEPITGWGPIGNNNDVYIMIDAGTLGAVFTLVAPVWSTTKQGWYVVLDRYVAKLRKDGAGAYTLKRMLAQDKTVDTGTVLDGAVARAKVADLAINSAKVDWDDDAGGTFAFTTAGETWTPPSDGLFMVITDPGSAGTNARLEMDVGGTWRAERWQATSSYRGSWTLFNKGGNTRFVCQANLAQTYYYRRMA